MEGVRLDRDELIRAYGISQRLAVRIGALLAKGLEVSATLLEMAGPGSALEKLLLHPEMLAGAERLDVEALKKLAAETGASREGELAIAPCANGRVLALQEEILAEQGLPLVCPSLNEGVGDGVLFQLATDGHDLLPLSTGLLLAWSAVEKLLHGQLRGFADGDQGGRDRVRVADWILERVVCGDEQLKGALLAGYGLVEPEVCHYSRNLVLVSEASGHFVEVREGNKRRSLILRR